MVFHSQEPGDKHPSTGTHGESILCSSDTIVIGVDESEYCLPALQAAQWIAKSSGCSVQLVHVAPSLDANYEYAWLHRGLIEKSRALLECNKKRMLSRMQEAIQDMPLSCHTTPRVVECNRPADALVDFSRRAQSKLTIVGSHGRGPASRFFLGSVAEQLASTSANNVLIARNPVREFLRVLVPVHFTTRSSLPKGLLLSIAPPPSAINLLHILDLDSAFTTWGLNEINEFQHEQASQGLHRMAEEAIRGGYDANTGVTKGSASEVIAQASQEHDLVVFLGSENQRGENSNLNRFGTQLIRNANSSVVLSFCRESSEDSHVQVEDERSQDSFVS